MTERYRDRLAALVAARSSQLCIGIDPSPAALALVGGELRAPAAGGPGRRADRARAIAAFGALLVDGAGPHAVAIKPQLAWYEAAGAEGIAALAETVAHARSVGLLVVLDGKRGDIPHSAAAYADAWLGDDAASGICGDALTVNATPGADALAAMAEVAHARGCELYALVLTSNPGAAALQAAPLSGDAPWAGRAWWQLVAEAVTACDVGAVVGATRPELFAELRTALPTAPLLVPGVGAQGGSMDDVASLGSALAGPVLVPVSRSLLPARAPIGTRDAAWLRAQVAAAATTLRAGPAPAAAPVSTDTVGTGDLSGTIAP